jgi:hypothetical protein
MTKSITNNHSFNIIEIKNDQCLIFLYLIRYKAKNGDEIFQFFKINSWQKWQVCFLQTGKCGRRGKKPLLDLSKRSEVKKV